MQQKWASESCCRSTLCCLSDLGETSLQLLFKPTFSTTLISFSHKWKNVDPANTFVSIIPKVFCKVLTIKCLIQHKCGYGQFWVVEYSISNDLKRSELMHVSLLHKLAYSDYSYGLSWISDGKHSTFIIWFSCCVMASAKIINPAN